MTPTSILCGRRGTCGTGLALVARLVPGDAVPFCVAIVALGCVAGVALGDPDLHFCVARVLFYYWFISPRGARGTC